MKSSQDNTQFTINRDKTIDTYSKQYDWQKLSKMWMECAFEHKYMYNFEWFGRPIIQTPTDILAMQELISQTKPDLIIETGIAHGGSLIFNASMLAMLDYCDAIEKRTMLNPSKPQRHVLGIDIDIRQQNRKAIESHPFSNRIEMIQGSSIDSSVISEVRDFAKDFNRVLVCLDSNHTHNHVLAELMAYSPIVSLGSYCVVFDTIIEDLPTNMFPDRPWSHGNNPMTAIKEFLSNSSTFEIDQDIDKKLMISVASKGFLKRVN
jgi:cephalosporin hydroxylase